MRRQDRRPSAGLNSHSGQTTPRDGSRDGASRSRPYVQPLEAMRPLNPQMPPPTRPGAAAALRQPLQVTMQKPTQFVPFGGAAARSRPASAPEPPMQRGPSPPPIQQELPTAASAAAASGEAMRQPAELMNEDSLQSEASQDAWNRGSQDSSTPHYNCTPDDNNPIIAKPPPPPSPKSHHRNVARYTASSRDSSDSDEEEPAAAEAAAGGAEGGDQDMDELLESASGAEDGADPQSPQFQISTVSLDQHRPNVPSSTPTPEGNRRASMATREESMGVSESISVSEEPADVQLMAAPRNGGRAARGHATRSIGTEMEAPKRARVNANKWCPHPPPKGERPKGSRSIVAGESFDQASEYEWLERLGEGSSGEVHKVRKLIDGWVYAMKKSKKRVVTKSERERALEEVFVLVAIQSPFIVRYYHSFIQECHLYILTEFCEGESLDRRVEDRRPCCEQYLLRLLWDMARALVHLHDRPVRPMVHLDIKPENIFSVNSYSPYDDAAQESSAAVAQMDAMVMSDDAAAHGSPTLSQLGAPTADASSAGGAAAAAARPSPEQSRVRLSPMEPHFKLGDCGLVTTSDGTLRDTEVEEGDRRYLSREFLEGDYTNLPAADIFALGITLYELAVGEPLPDGGDRMTELRDGTLRPMPTLSNPFQGLIRQMMHPKAEQRPSAAWLAHFAETQLKNSEEGGGAEGFGRVPRKSGPFSPLESPFTASPAAPSPIPMAESDVSPAPGSTPRELLLQREAQELRAEM